MKQIGRRLYFDRANGEIIQQISERQGEYVVETTVDEDFEAYAALKERVRETVGYVQLEYGAYADNFNRNDFVRVNPDTLDIEFAKRPTDPDEEPVYEMPLSDRLEELEARQSATEEAILALMDLGMMS